MAQMMYKCQVSLVPSYLSSLSFEYYSTDNNLITLSCIDGRVLCLSLHSKGTPKMYSCIEHKTCLIAY